VDYTIRKIDQAGIEGRFANRGLIVSQGTVAEIEPIRGGSVDRSARLAGKIARDQAITQSDLRTGKKIKAASRPGAAVPLNPARFQAPLGILPESTPAASCGIPAFIRDKGAVLNEHSAASVEIEPTSAIESIVFPKCASNQVQVRAAFEIDSASHKGIVAINQTIRDCRRKILPRNAPATAATRASDDESIEDCPFRQCYTRRKPSAAVNHGWVQIPIAFFSRSLGSTKSPIKPDPGLKHRTFVVGRFTYPDFVA